MRGRFLLLASLFFCGSTALVACGGGDEDTPDDSTPRKTAGTGGKSGSSAAGNDSGGNDSGGNDSGGKGGSGGKSGQGGAAGQGGAQPACFPEPPALPACGSGSTCQECVCDKCGDDLSSCLGDPECEKAISCVFGGCNPSLCATLTTGEDSLLRADAVGSCISSKKFCREACLGGGSAGAAGAAGAAGSAQGGAGGEPGGSGGAGGFEPASTPQCCAVGTGPGCSGKPLAEQSNDETNVEGCVCSQDAYCCQTAWDEACVQEVGEYGCAPACPDPGGMGGAAGTGGAGGADPGGNGGAAGTGGDECQPLLFPSGLTLKTVKDPALTALYEALEVTTCEVPRCFIDASDLRDGADVPQSIKAKVSANFALYEIIRTEVDPKNTGAYDPLNAYSPRVLVSPEFVEKLQKLREIYNAAVNITSGYRSPQHQKELCNSICGADECVESGTVTCAKNSRHMWGAAADMDLKYEGAAKQAGFPFVFNESGGTAPHLHVDMQSCKLARPGEGGATMGRHAPRLACLFLAPRVARLRRR